MKKRLMAALIATLIVAKSVSAFVGVPLLFAPPVVTTATGLALSTWAAIAAGVGAMLYTIGLRDNAGNEFMRVRVNPNAPAEVPSGWTAASNAANDPIPPNTAGGPTTQYALVGVNLFFNTAQMACDAFYQSNGQSGGHIVYAPTATCSSASTIGCCFGNEGGGNIAFYTQTSCPTGYTNTSGTCTLSNASAVRYPANSRCGLRISGGVMTYDSRDPDCDTPPAGMLSTDGKTLTVTQGGQRVQVKINTDGTVTVTQWTPSASGTTTTMNSARAGDPASASSSQIKSASQSTTTATGEDAFSQAPAGQTPQFPDDYARDATVAAGNAVLGQINTKLADIKTQLTTDGMQPSDPTPRSQGDVEGIFFPGTFDPLKSWSMPARSVACPTWSFTIWSHSYTLDSHCSLIENQRAVVSTICLLVYALIALFIVLGA